MQLAFWVLALLILVAMNYWASRALRPPISMLVLLTTCLPAIGLVGYTGFRLAYAIANADEANRRFREYFGADQAFVVSLVLGGLWVAMAYAGSRSGRRSNRTSR